MNSADLQITLAPNALIARVNGEIDMSNAEEIGAAVIGAMPGEAVGVVLDLSTVDYLDSAGIYVIYGIRSSLQARGQALILVIPARSPVRDALRLAGVQQPGEVAGSVEDALHALEDPAPPGG